MISTEADGPQGFYNPEVTSTPFQIEAPHCSSEAWQLWPSISVSRRVIMKMGFLVLQRAVGP